MTTTQPRTYNLNAAHAAWTEGAPRPVEAITGRHAVFTTWEGARMVGTVEATPDGSMYPIVRFPDGRWARLDNHIELVD